MLVFSFINLAMVVNFRNEVKDNKDPLSELDLEAAASQHCIPSSLEKLFELVQSPIFQPYSVLLQREFSQPERHDVFFCSALDGSPSSTELMEKLIERLKRRNACLVRAEFIYTIYCLVCNKQNRNKHITFLVSALGLAQLLHQIF